MSSRKRSFLIATSLVLALGVGYAIRAAASGIPATSALSYAGVLEDANGPVNGMPNIQVILYDAPTAGNNLCQSPPGVATTVTNGHFSVPLPDTCVTNGVAANPNVWVHVLVNGSDTGPTKIGAVPYAVEANHTPNADNATNAEHASTADTATTATNATNATNAINAAGALGTTLSAIQGDIATLQMSPISASGFINGGASTAIVRQNPSWMQSVVHVSTGNYTIAFQANFFSSSPDCALTPAAGGLYMANIFSETATGITLYTSTSDGQSLADADFAIVCVGPR